MNFAEGLVSNGAKGAIENWQTKSLQYDVVASRAVVVCDAGPKTKNLLL